MWRWCEQPSVYIRRIERGHIDSALKKDYIFGKKGNGNKYVGIESALWQ